MRYCVIGIHSDRIAMEIKEGGARQGEAKEGGRADAMGYITLYRESAVLPLESCVHGQSINREGIELILEGLEQMLSYGQKLICEEIFCFATSVLRYANNRQEILDKIQEKLGVTTEVLTGMQQCAACFRQTASVSGRASGLGCQIGGGSTQLYLFSEGKLAQCASLPVGHARLYGKCVSSVLPNRIEAEEIRQATKEALQECDFLKEQPHRTIYMMGDCCEKVNKLALSVSGNLEISKYSSIKPPEYRLIYNLLHNRNLNGVALLDRMFPDSVTTLFPAMLMMETIGKRCGAEEQIVLKTSLEADFFQQKMEQLIHNA